MRRGTILFIVLFLSAGALVGGRFGRFPGHKSPTEEFAAEPSVRQFTEALKLIEDHYVDTPDKGRITRTAVLGALHSLDPHSNFFDKREFGEMQDEQSSKFFGVGVTINQRNGRIYVLGTTQGMPAERAGLRYGDALIAVNGKSTRGWTQHDTQTFVRGDRGTPVELTVERLGSPEPLTFRVVRDEVPFPSVRNAFVIRPGVGYIGLTGGFNQTTGEEVREALATLKAQGVNSIVLDLRRNPGGLFRQAVEVAEEFLPRSVEIVAVASRDAKTKRQVYRSENDEPQSMPLVVLINGETASASEIVAGAIQDRDRGLIVGEPSFGKGLVQTVFRLPGGTGLTLTTAKYYTPSGRSIQRAYAGVGLYDYYLARALSGSHKIPATPPRPHADETVYTPTGRRLAGGGGIEPDIVVRAPEENYVMRDACFEFVRRVAVGLVDGLEQYRVLKLEHGHEIKPGELQPSESMLQAFRIFLREKPEYRNLEPRLSENLDYVRRRLRTELITANYGTEAAERFLLESDVQAMRAIEALPQAKHLTDLAHLFTPVPRSSQTAR